MATKKPRPQPACRANIARPIANDSRLKLELGSFSFTAGLRGTKKGSKRMSCGGAMWPPKEIRSTIKPPPMSSIKRRSVSMAPCTLPQSRRSAASKRLCVRSSEHKSMAAWLAKVLRSRFAPCFNNFSTRSHRPMKMATCRGVQPTTSTAENMLAPALLLSSSTPMNNSTIDMAPLRHAACKHVVPLRSQAKRLAPRASNQRTATKFEVAENKINWRSTSFSEASVSGKTAPAGSQIWPSSAPASSRWPKEIRVQFCVHRS
mmetsp:Transcript_125444/g.360484  ORF Transcript_125444/g.360484 Transcript_125444/m.360484 type:complete len:261 (+) Transcript_125444:1487-2269(+)